MKNVLIFFGGTSPERDISVISGVLTANSLDKERYNAIPVYVHSDGGYYIGKRLANLDFYKTKDLKKCERAVLLPGGGTLYTIHGNRLKRFCEADCAINCMHGIGGEDGSLSGIIKNCKIPLASPDIYPSAVAIDKHYTKLALKAVGVQFVDYVRIKRSGFFSKPESVTRIIAERLSFPIIVKPANLGSSIGIKRVDDEKALFNAICEAFGFDCKVVCEKYIDNAIEINCAAYMVGGKIHISELERPFTAHDILTFDDKYGGYKQGGGNKEFPANVDSSIKMQVREWVRKVYNEFDFSGIVRFDFLVKDDRVYLNEINAVPGSLAYYLFCNKISEFSILLTSLIEEAERRQREIDGRVNSFESKVLSGDWQSIKK